jgi:hypothetical protein
MQNAILVRELVGWMLDDYEYRPADYDRCKHSHAQQLIAQRLPFQPCNALLEDETAAIQDILEPYTSRPDLLAEMNCLDWSLGVVDLRLLIAFQRRLSFNSLLPPVPTPDTQDWPALTAVSFGPPKPAIYSVLRETNTNALVFRSSDPNLYVRASDDPLSPLIVHAGSPFFEVAYYCGRWFLRDGYHRAYALLEANVFKIPAVIVHARTLEELGATQPWFFHEEVLLSATPPRVTDFLDDALVIEYNRPPLIKTLRVTIEETLAPAAHPGD